MRYGWLLYRLRLKAALHSPLSLACAALFLLLALAFGLLLPAGAPASLTVGVLPRTEIARDALAVLQENGDYTVTEYGDLQALQADVLSGKLHCGYEMSDEWADPSKPVTVYATDASYLRPLTDQLVLAAYFEAKLPRVTQEYLDRHGYGEKEAAALLERQRREAKTMEVELRTLGAAPAQEVSQGMQPLLYALLASLFLAVAVLEALLTPASQAKAQRHLAAMGGHRASSAAAPILAAATVRLAVLLAADGALWVLYGGRMAYPAAARMTMLLLLALASVIPAAAAGALGRRPLIAAALLPPWLLAGVFCSGALVSPELLPMGLGVLRFLSPGWYALGWMALF